MILTKHSLTVEASCPVDDTLDVYEVTVQTSELIEVEHILHHIDKLTAREPIHQEEFTRMLAHRLRAKVTTKGVHSGIKTKCVAKPW